MFKLCRIILIYRLCLLLETGLSADTPITFRSPGYGATNLSLSTSRAHISTNDYTTQETTSIVLKINKLRFVNWLSFGQRECPPPLHFFA